MADNVHIVFGSFPISHLPTEEVSKILPLLKQYGVNEWDTARIYPDSESTIGNLGITNEIVIDTKIRGFEDGCLSRESILESATQSLKELKVESVNILYFHSPDKITAIEESVDAINELYKQGKFKKFGLSNFTVEDVKKVYEYSKKNNYVLPSVFQGNYNAFSRGVEKELFPLLRKYNMSFFAYSPIAGGFLVKTTKQVEEGQGRFDTTSFIGQMYNKMYNRPSLMKGLEKWGEIAEENKLSKAHMAFRWIAYHSELSKNHGDGLIFGGRNYEQFKDTLTALKDGPLSAKVAAEIEEIWKSIENEAPLNNLVY